ncbi:hypothetical protein Bbelb_436690 [Branchiostoma belcheri]|nr:hypothetical protein Bbelb_436690 [Branchiostoma belcheri]
MQMSPRPPAQLLYLGERDADVAQVMLYNIHPSGTWDPPGPPPSCLFRGKVQQGACGVPGREAEDMTVPGDERSSVTPTLSSSTEHVVRRTHHPTRTLPVPASCLRATPTISNKT